MTRSRIYVCHTFYHVYITFLKEFKLRAQQALQPDQKVNPAGTATASQTAPQTTPQTAPQTATPIEAKSKTGATLVLSSLSNNFYDLQARIEATGFFDAVIPFDEKRDTFFPELQPLRQDTGNFLKNLINRIEFTKQYAKCEAAYIPVDFKKYDDIYVFCDSDPIGIYLSQNRIPYHALEDGLNCIRNYDAARFDNRGHFGIKRFLSEKLNLIFIQNGYNKYCIDMEVNDASVIQFKLPKFKEEPRAALAERLTQEEKDLLLRAFIRDKESLEQQIAEAAENGNGILILTDPLCTLDVRERIFRDIIDRYKTEGAIFIKPHPRDELGYRTLFPEYPQFDATMPMEVLNYFPGVHFKKVVTVLTEVSAISFADEKDRLGEDFMDKYEDPAIHRQNERVGIARVRKPEEG